MMGGGEEDCLPRLPVLEGGITTLYYDGRRRGGLPATPPCPGGWGSRGTGTGPPPRPAAGRRSRTLSSQHRVMSAQAMAAQINCARHYTLCISED